MWPARMFTEATGKHGCAAPLPMPVQWALTALWAVPQAPERNLNGFVDIAESEAIFREEHFPFAVGVILLKHPWEFVEGETLPDIFDPAFEQLIESRAEAACPAAADDPLVMGYYYGFGAFNHSEHWVNHHLSLPPDSPWTKCHHRLARATV